LPSCTAAIVRFYIDNFNKDVHADINKEGNERVAKIHANAEVFDPKTENIFKYLQVVTASAVAFVHGANDVANAVGALTAVYSVYVSHSVQLKASQPRWILVIGALGIVAGLATYGYRMIMVGCVSTILLRPPLQAATPFEQAPSSCSLSSALLLW
jgi:sodium-dependent phosphate transporter